MVEAHEVERPVGGEAGEVDEGVVVDGRVQRDRRAPARVRRSTRQMFEPGAARPLKKSWVSGLPPGVVGRSELNSR